MKKRCTKCGEVKAYSEFAWREKRKGRLSSECKVCHRKLRNKHYANHSEETKQAVQKRKTEIRKMARRYLKRKPLRLRDKCNGKMISEMLNNGWSWDRIRQEIDKASMVFNG